MKNGDVVQFQITGMTSRFRGVVSNAIGHLNRPEITVTDYLTREGWVPVNPPWPTLKDGDYILESN